MNSEAWSRHSKSYNAPSGQSQTLPMVQSAFDAQWFAKLDKFIADRNSPLRVLLLACGTGAEVEVLCGRYSKQQMTILATDFATGMVEATKSCSERVGKQDMVEARVMDAMNIDEPPCSFDAVFLVLGPMLMPDPSRVFKEIQRVLIPGGFSAYLTPGRMQIHDIFNQARKEILTECNRESEFISFYDSAMMTNWGTPEALQHQLLSAHFINVECETVKSNQIYERGAQVDEMLDRLFDNPGVSQMYTNGLPDQEAKKLLNKVRAAFHKQYPAMQGTSPATPYLTANAGCGCKPSVDENSL